MNNADNRVLQVEGLSKKYGNIQAVHNLSFSVQQGEMFGILGPNGAGKSTSLECILGVKKKDSGHVTMLGMDPVKDRTKLFARVGVQFQDSAWQTGIKVWEICEATACLYSPVPEWRGMLTKFDLEKRIKAEASTLSGGERQKLSILLAWIHSPELVFLDELTSGLDPLARREMWRFMKAIQEVGTTVVLTSHYMDEVEALCQRGIMIKEGSIVAQGSIEELILQGKGKNLDESYIHIMETI